MSKEIKAMDKKDNSLTNESPNEIKKFFLEILKNFEETAGPILDSLVVNDKILQESGKGWNFLFGLKAKTNQELENFFNSLQLPTKSHQDLILHKLMQIELKLNKLERLIEEMSMDGEKNDRSN